MKLINSYPRSGSSRLKLIICNILYPDVKHDMETVSQYIPSIDNREQRNNNKACDFFCTHSPIDSDIYLYRNVGDVLISEYWYKQKYYPDDQSLFSYIFNSKYGENWRRSVDAGRSAKIKLSFHDLGDAKKLHSTKIIPEASLSDYKEAIKKTSFEKLKKMEKKSGANPDIPYFRKGTSKQIDELPHNIRTQICRANEGELKYLKLMYYDQDTGQYLHGVR